MSQSLPPNDPAAECGALACLLSSSEPEKILTQLSLDDFYDERHREIFNFLKAIQREGGGLNVISLVTRLKAYSRLESAGGMEFVSRLPDQTPSAENFPYFLETVKDRATRRAALRDAAELSLLASDLAIPVKSIAAAAEKMTGAHSRNGQSKGELPPIVDATEFVARPHPHPPEVVRGILHQGSKLVLGGGSKSFKTWMLLDLALSVGHGRDWMGFETEQGSVLYLNFEIQDYAWHGRLLTVAKSKQIALQAGAVKLWNLRGSATDFQTLLPRVANQTRRAGYSLIVLDPIYKLYGRADENKATDVASLLNGIEALAVDTGAAIAFGAHFSKGNQAGKEAIDRISGSGVFARDPDSILVFTRHEEENAFGVECILRNFSPVEPFAVRWQFPLMSRDGDLDPSKLKKVGGRNREYAPEAILELLDGDTLTSAQWFKRAKEDAGMSRGTFYTLLGQVQKSRHVVKSHVNGKWIKASK